MKTYSQKPTEVKRSWYVINASNASFGRVATAAASLLIGKGKATSTPHVDGGDFVVIINAGNMQITGGKETKKTYYRHSGFPGGIYERSLREQHQRDSTAVLRQAVRGMLPDNKLRDNRLARLKIYEGSDHNHSAQKPQEISAEAMK